MAERDDHEVTSGASANAEEGEQGYLLHAGRRIATPPAGLTIGRAAGSDIELSGVRASRAHARVDRDPEGS